MPDQHTPPPSIRLPPAAILALLLVAVLAHFFHAAVRIQLQNDGVSPDHAYNLTYLVVPLILVGPLLVILRGQLPILKGCLAPDRLTLRIVFSAIAIGFLLRVVYWAQLVTRIAFGVTLENGGATGPDFAISCPPPNVLWPGILTMAVLVPVTEETVHRGVLQSAFVPRGPVVAIGLSATLFALFHQPSGYVFVFLTGLVIGSQFWRTQTLWATMITHATYNALIQFDWICLNGRWNPDRQDLPLIMPGVVAVMMGASAVLGIALLLLGIRPGREQRPGAVH